MKRIGIIFTICLVTINLAKGQEKTAGQLLNDAIYSEEVNGDLTEAIRIYQDIISKHPDKRAIAAQACFNMGMCYEKLGKSQAIEAYRQVLSNYSDQDAVVAEARERLDNLESQQTPEPEKGISIRKIWSGPDVDLMGGPSPDGKYFSYVNWASGDLALYEIASGHKRILTKMGSWDDPNEFAEYSRWSPDGKQIVFDWYSDDNPGFIELYTLRLDGSSPRLLYSNEEFNWTQCYDWSPDGKQVLACFSIKDTSNLIGLVSTIDGSMRIVKELEKNSWPQNMKISPDGRFIAYDLSPDKDRREKDIYLLSINGSNETTVVKHPANDILLGWTPDGKGLLFGSERSGAMGSWRLQMVDGKPLGEPELVKSDMGPIMPFGFTDRGSFYYGIHERMHDIFIAELDKESGLLAGPVKKAVRHFEGYNQAPAYSPDGKFLAYVSKRSPLMTPLGLRYGANALCIKSLETGTEKELYPELDLIGFPSWSPDGTSIVLVHWNYNDRIELCQVDVHTGDVKMVSRPGDNFSHFGGHKWSPSGKIFYYGLRNSAAEKDWRIMAMDMESGKTDTIYRSGDFYTISISPDGDWFALTCPSNEDAHIKIVSTDGKVSRELYRFKEGTEIGRVPSTCWTADGKYILFGMDEPETEEEEFELCRIPAAGGEPVKTGLKMGNVFLNVDAHPDGRHITFSNAESVAEIWVMENFLSE